MADAATKMGGTWTTFQQLKVQLTAVGLTAVFTAVATYIITIVVEKTVGFRLEEQHEMAGMDHSLHSEHGYGLINPN